MMSMTRIFDQMEPKERDHFIERLDLAARESFEQRGYRLIPSVPRFDLLHKMSQVPRGDSPHQYFRALYQTIYDFFGLTDKTQAELLKAAEATVRRERFIASELEEHPYLTREQAAARVDAELTDFEEWQAERGAAERELEQLVRNITAPTTLGEIARSSGFNFASIGRMCAYLAGEEGLFEPLERGRYSNATRVIPKR